MFLLFSRSSLVQLLRRLAFSLIKKSKVEDEKRNDKTCSPLCVARSRNFPRKLLLFSRTQAHDGISRKIISEQRQIDGSLTFPSKVFSVCLRAFEQSKHVQEKIRFSQTLTLIFRGK